MVINLYCLSVKSNPENLIKLLEINRALRNMLHGRGKSSAFDNEKGCERPVEAADLPFLSIEPIPVTTFFLMSDLRL